MKQLFVVLSVLVLLSCAPKENPASTKIDEAKTQEIFDRHFKAFKENNVDAIVADYSDDAIIVTADATVTGVAQIKPFFERVFSAFPKDSSTYEFTKTVVKNDVAYTVWKCKTPKVEYVFATDSFIIQDGKIVRQTFAGLMP